MKYYITYNGQQVGPMTREQLLSYGLNPNSQVWAEGMPQWVPAYTVPELMEIMPPAAGQTQTAPTYGQPEGCCPGVSGKRIGAGVLAILLGSLGIQYFYINKIGGGFLTILLSFVTCGLWSVLMLVQGILMLTMTDQEFDRKFIHSKNLLPLF